MRFFFFWIVVGLLAGVAILYLQGHIGLQPAVSSPDMPADIIGSPRGSYADAVQKAAPAVVSLQVKSLVNVPLNEAEQRQIEQFFGNSIPHLSRPKEILSSGSGVILDDAGYILTNHHVIKQAREVEVLLIDGRAALAKLAGTDPDTDLAVLKIELDNLPHATIADMDRLQIGDVVLAIGYPLNIGQTVTQGIISATGRNQVSRNTYENYLQTDAAINRGNSGGALINTDGEIVGINSLIYTETGAFNGIGFAIPMDIATDVYEQIRDNGYVVRGWLGAEGSDLPTELLRSMGLENVRGIIVTGVDAKGPGDAAGLKPGDIITHINGHEITSTVTILNLIAEGKPGDEFRIDGLRNRQSFTTTAILAQRPMMSQ